PRGARKAPRCPRGGRGAPTPGTVCSRKTGRPTGRRRTPRGQGAAARGAPARRASTTGGRSSGPLLCPSRLRSPHDPAAGPAPKPQAATSARSLGMHPLSHSPRRGKGRFRLLDQALVNLPVQPLKLGFKADLIKIPGTRQIHREVADDARRARAEDYHAIGEGDGFLDVVGDKEDALAKALPDPQKLLPDA